MHRLKTLFIVVFLLLFTATFALASGDVGQAHELPWKNFAYRIINFIAVLAIIYYFFGKKIAAFFKGRSEGIAAEIATLEERKREMQQNLKEVEKRIANLDRECQALLAEHIAQGETMKAAIIAQAQKTAEQITVAAKKTADNEINAAISAMRAEMAEHIVAATETLLAQKLSAPDHAKLIDKYLTKVVIN
ncbi:MAG: ATP synthase F0 subunit B [Desulfovibrio sp.]|nr:ATP synthase F0 subunit B [Desulfovibrio sp.]